MHGLNIVFNAQFASFSSTGVSGSKQAGGGVGRPRPTLVTQGPHSTGNLFYRHHARQRRTPIAVQHRGVHFKLVLMRQQRRPASGVTWHSKSSKKSSEKETT